MTNRLGNPPLQLPAPTLVRTCWTSLLLCAALLCAPTLQGFAASPAEVDKAIEIAKETLYKHQKNGHWESTTLPDLDKGPASTEGGQWGGLTSIATYALLASGDSPQSSKLKPAIEFLKKADIKGIYALGLRLQVWRFLPKEEARPLIDHDARLLLMALKSKGDGLGFYSYLTTASGGYDHSCSQYGVLGLWAAAEAEQPFEVPEKFWEIVENAWLRDQDKSGGWSYKAGAGGINNMPPTMTMTAAGVATLYITQDYVHGMEGINCKGNIHNPGIEAGVKWMADHFKEVGGNLYGWYGIERIGVASGLKYFGNIDWYREGCNVIVPRAGSWADHGPVVGTSFALLFMVRGRASVVMSKLNYDLSAPAAPGGKPAAAPDKSKEAHWNQRPRDAANITRFISHELDNLPLNWQSVNLNVPADELHDAPILYIAGDQPLNFTKEHEDKLRQYVEQGGLILVNADCNNTTFLNSILKGNLQKPALAQRLFPMYEPRKLPADHPIYTQEMFQKKSWKENVDLTAVGNGSREFMLVFNGDPAKYWQTRTLGGREAYHQVMANIFLYVTEKKVPRFKGVTYIETQNTAVKATRTMKVARLEYAGNWDPEPGGWRRMANYMHNHQSLDLTVDNVKLGEGKLDNSYKLAAITGNVKFHLGEKQQAELKAFTDGGGLLVVDACGGSGEFTASVEPELTTLFGEDFKQTTTPLSLEDGLFGDPKIEEVTYRRTAQKMLVGKIKSPQLRAIVRNGKPVCYYSPQDLSVGLVGQDVDGIYGYSPETATDIMRNIILKAGGLASQVPEKRAAPAAPAKAAAPPAKQKAK